MAKQPGILFELSVLLPHPTLETPCSILCLAREMLGTAAENAVLELNASDARGIDVVRNKIKMFAKKKVTLPAGKHKIIILGILFLVRFASFNLKRLVNAHRRGGLYDGCSTASSAAHHGNLLCLDSFCIGLQSEH